MFETIVLKHLLVNGEYFNKVLPILDKEYFQDIGNSKTFDLIQQYYIEYKEIPNVTSLVGLVKNVPNKEIRDEIVKSLRAVSSVEKIDNIEYLCNESVKFVRDALYMEALQTGSDGLMKKDDDLKLKAQEILDKRAKVSIDTDLGLDFDDIQIMIDYYSERLAGIKTDLKSLNDRLGPGFLPGTLSVILSPSGIGKSLMMTHIISNLIKDGKKVLLVSLEMADKEIMKRIHANAMNLPINSLIDLSKTNEELKELSRPALTKEMILERYNSLNDGSLGKLYVKDYPAGSFSSLMLENLVNQYSLEKDVNFDIVFIDYIGIMKSDRISLNSGLYSYVKSIAEEVRASAKRLDLPIISASQLNRGATNNTEDADNANVSDSLGTVMTADFMLFLLQNEEMKEREEIIFKITKNRLAGVTDTWMMNIDYTFMRFQEMTPSGEVSSGNSVNSFGSSNTDNSLDDDFGIITAEKQKDAEEYGNAAVKQIIKDDAQVVREAGKNPKSDEPITDLDDLYKELGID